MARRAGRERIIDQRHGQRGGAPPQTPWISRATALGRGVKFTTLGSCFGRGRDASANNSHTPLLRRFGHARGLLRSVVPGIDRLPASHARASGRFFAGLRTGRRHARGPHDHRASSLLFLTGPCSSSTVPRTAPPGSPTRQLYVPSDALFPVARVGSCRHPRHLQPQRAQGFALVQRGARLDHIARMYHSVAFLLPDASVLIAGSNPNIDVELTAPYPTTYTAEIFYPPYFSSSVRPQVMGVPPTLSYGGSYFHLSVSSTSDTGITWPPTRRSCSPGAASRRTREHGSAACAAQQFVQCQR